MTDVYTVKHRRIPWVPAEGPRPLPLGRNLHHDSRSLAYLYRAGTVPVVDRLWPRRIGILDQLQVGSCTGNAEVGALGTDPLFDTLAPAGKQLNGEATALALYSAAETIDGDGPYPPQDNGSSGLSVCQAAKNEGLISGYTHCLTAADVLQALMAGPVLLGIDWYSSFDHPAAAAGVVSIAPGATIRGGHEIVARGVDVTAQMIVMDNSWGTSWGDGGRFQFSFATLERLLADGGDCTVPVPLSQPAPVPAPFPPSPAPVPPAADAADLALVQALDPWAAEHHVGQNAHAATSYQAWREEKGLF